MPGDLAIKTPVLIAQYAAEIQFSIFSTDDIVAFRVRTFNQVHLLVLDPFPLKFVEFLKLVLLQDCFYLDPEQLFQAFRVRTHQGEVFVFDGYLEVIIKAYGVETAGTVV